MNEKQLKLLLIIGAIIIVIALIPSIINIVNNSKQTYKSLTGISIDNLTEIDLTLGSNIITLKKDSSGNWKANDFTGDKSVIDDLTTKISEALILYAVSKDTNNYSLFGISDASSKVTVKSSTNSKTFFVGKATTTAEGTYVKIDGDDSVYAINQNLTSIDQKEITFFRDKTISAINTEIVTAVETNLVSIVKNDSKWNLKSDSSKTLDTNKVTTFIDAVAALEGSGIATGDEVTKITSTQPILTVQITAGTNTYSYKIYKVDSNYYAQKDGDTTYYSIELYKFDNINKKESDLV